MTSINDYLCTLEFSCELFIQFINCLECCSINVTMCPYTAYNVKIDTSCKHVVTSTSGIYFNRLEGINALSHETVVIVKTVCINIVGISPLIFNILEVAKSSFLLMISKWKCPLIDVVTKN